MTKWPFNSSHYHVSALLKYQFSQKSDCLKGISSHNLCLSQRSTHRTSVHLTPCKHPTSVCGRLYSILFQKAIVLSTYWHQTYLKMVQSCKFRKAARSYLKLFFKALSSAGHRSNEQFCSHVCICLKAVWAAAESGRGSIDSAVADQLISWLLVLYCPPKAKDRNWQESQTEKNDFKVFCTEED